MWRWVVLSWVVLPACIGSCEEQVDDGAAPPIPNVVITPNDEFVVALYGKPFTITATLTNDDGSPATNYTWQWMHADAILNTPWTLNASSPSPGVEVVTFTPPYLAVSQIWGRINTCGAYHDSPCFYENNADTPYVDVVPWGGTAVKVFTPSADVSLVVGENRPLGAVAISDALGFYHYSDEALAYDSSSPSIATIDATGVVHALTLGDASITITAGAASTTVALHVVAGSVTPMPDGIRSLHDQDPHWHLMPDPGNPLHKLVAYDISMGAMGPHVITNLMNGDAVSGSQTTSVFSRSGSFPWGTMGHAAWTGSGFGWETPGERFDAAIDPMISIDERGTEYVFYNSGNRRQYVVLDRPAGGAPGSERMRLLPREIDEAKALGAKPRDYSMVSDLDWSAIVPRKGGGAWVAYTVHGNFGSAFDSDTLKDCGVAGFVAEVTDNEIRVVQQFSKFWYLVSGDCDDGQGGETPGFLMMLSDPNGGRPGVNFRGLDLTHPGLVTTTAAYQADGGMATFGAIGDYGGREVFDGQMIGILSGGWGWHSGLDDRNRQDYHGDSPWIDLGITANSPTWPDESKAFVGATFDDTRFGLLVLQGVPNAQYSIGQTRLAHPILWSADETAGRRWTQEANSPAITDPPVVLADGRRMWLSRNIGACYTDLVWEYGLWRSSGPGMRPTLVAPQNTPTYTMPLQAVGNALYTLFPDASTTYGFRVRQSLDGGTTWTTPNGYNGQASYDRLHAFATLPSGAAFVLMGGDADSQNFALIYTANIATGPWTALPGFSAGQLGIVPLETTGDEGFGFAIDGVNMWSIVAVKVNGGNGVLARKYSPGGVQLDEILVAFPPDGTGPTRPQANKSVVSGTKLLVLARELANGPRYRLDAAVIDTGTHALTIGLITAQGSGRVVPPIRMPDGRFVVGGQLTDLNPGLFGTYDARRDHAVLWSSTGGVTWSAPKLLRPSGGNGQVIWSMGVDSDGKLFEVVGDSGNLLPAEVFDEYYFRTNAAAATCGATQQTTGIQRSDPP